MKELTYKQYKRLLVVMYVLFYLVLVADTSIILYDQFRSRENPGIHIEPEGPGLFDAKKGLVLWLPLDEEKGKEAHDATRQSPPGLLKGFDFKNSSGPGRINRALSFDGIDDSIMLSDPIKGDFTIAFWIKLTANFETSVETEFGRASSPLLSFISSDSNIHMSIDGENIDGSNYVAFFTDDPAQQLLGRKPLNLNEWYHVACNMKVDTGEKTMLINGVRDVQFTTKKRFFPGVNVLEIGSQQMQKKYFQGSVDELRVYSRALSDDEVLQVYCISGP